MAEEYNGATGPVGIGLMVVRTVMVRGRTLGTVTQSPVQVSVDSLRPSLHQ